MEFPNKTEQLSLLVRRCTRRRRRSCQCRQRLPRRHGASTLHQSGRSRQRSPWLRQALHRHCRCAARMAQGVKIINSAVRPPCAHPGPLRSSCLHSCSHAVLPSLPCLRCGSPRMRRRRAHPPRRQRSPSRRPLSQRRTGQLHGSRHTTGRAPSAPPACVPARARARHAQPRRLLVGSRQPSGWPPSPAARCRMTAMPRSEPRCVTASPFAALRTCCALAAWAG